MLCKVKETGVRGVLPRSPPANEDQSICHVTIFLTGSHLAKLPGKSVLNFVKMGKCAGSRKL